MTDTKSSFIVFYIFIYINANFCVLLLFLQRNNWKKIFSFGWPEYRRILGNLSYFPRKKRAVISFFFSKFTITKDMNPHIVKPKIIRITSLRNGIMNLKDFTMLSIRVRWQVYMPNDSIPISWINLLNLLLLFKSLRAIPTITRTASIAVTPLYVYCNNDVGKCGIVGIQAGNSCMFQNHANTAHNSPRNIMAGLLASWSLLNLCIA